MVLVKHVCKKDGVVLILGPSGNPLWFITDVGGFPQTSASIFPAGPYSWVSPGDTIQNTGQDCDNFWGSDCADGTYWGNSFTDYQWPYSNPNGPNPTYNGISMGESIFTGNIAGSGFAFANSSALLPSEGLVAGQTYRMTIEMRIPKAVWPVSSQGRGGGVDECGWPGTGPTVGPNPGKLLIIGGGDDIATGNFNNQADNNQLLASMIVDDENANNFTPGNTRIDWTTYTIIFTPDQSHSRMMLTTTNVEGYSNAYLMLSNLKIYTTLEGTSTSGTEYICDCPEGYSLVDNLGNPTDICRENNQCVKTSCECPVVDGNIVSSETGNCDTYEEYMGIEINPLPSTCFYDFVSCIEPSNEIGGIWKHNVRCDLFANYYTKQYPWEIEIVSSMGQTVEMLRSVEYQLEVFDYITNYAKDSAGNDILTQPLNLNCEDRYQELTYNFNEAIIYNNEQVSGLLKLDMQPADPPLITSYPIIGGADIRILYDKVEQQFRFDQFWDITNNRNVAETQFITQMNGYIRDLNEANMDYNKPELQRKKFRNYFNKVLLRRMPIEAGFDEDGNMTYEPENKKMLLKLVNTKLNHSFR